MLTCEECKLVETGPAWNWIAVLVEAEEDGEPSLLVTYCPDCAEEQFQFFSLRHGRRRDDDFLV